MSERLCEEVRLPLAGSEWLRGHWSHVSTTSFAVVFLHGFGSVRRGEKSIALEQECAARGWTYTAFDFRSHGESSGTQRDLRGSRLLQDIDTVYRFLADRGIERICLVGSSMGGWTAAWYALLQPERVPAIALIAPGFHFLSARWERLNPEEREAWRQTGFLKIQSQWLNAELGYGLVEEIPLYPQDRLTRELRTPTLIFHGMKDELVPYQRIIDFLEHAAHPQMELRLFKNGDHRLNDRKVEMAVTACNFFDRWLNPPAPVC